MYLTEEMIAEYAGTLVHGFLKESRNPRTQRNDVAIFMDLDNVYWSLMKRYSHNPDSEVPEKNLFERLWEHYGKDNIRMFKAYADFEQIDCDLTSLQMKRIQIRHVYANGRSGVRAKNASDIELCIDAMESLYKHTNITCYVFVTADSDMIPIMSRMMYKGKRVELFYVKEAVSSTIDIRTYAHEAFDIVDFLEIEKPNFNIEDCILPAIQSVNKWHLKHKGTNKTLGRVWCRNALITDLKIADSQAEELIVYMMEKGILNIDPVNGNENYKITGCFSTTEIASTKE